MDDELLRRVIVGASTTEEAGLVESWKARAPENAEQYHELARVLALTERAESLRSPGSIGSTFHA